MAVKSKIEYNSSYNEYIRSPEGRTSIGLSRFVWMARMQDARRQRDFAYDNKELVESMARQMLLDEYMLYHGAIRCPKNLYDLWCEARINEVSDNNDNSETIEPTYKASSDFEDDNWMLLTEPGPSDPITLAKGLRKLNIGLDTPIMGQGKPLHIMLGPNLSQSIKQSDRNLLGVVNYMDYINKDGQDLCFAKSNSKEVAIYQFKSFV